MKRRFSHLGILREFIYKPYTIKYQIYFFEETKKQLSEVIQRGLLNLLKLR